MAIGSIAVLAGKKEKKNLCNTLLDLRLDQSVNCINFRGSEPGPICNRHHPALRQPSFEIDYCKEKIDLIIIRICATVSALQPQGWHLSKPRIFTPLPLSVLLSRDTRCKDSECFRVQLFFSCQAWWQPHWFRIHYSIGQTSYNLQLSPVVNPFLFFFLCLASSFLNYYYYEDWKSNKKMYIHIID